MSIPLSGFSQGGYVGPDGFNPIQVHKFYCHQCRMPASSVVAGPLIDQYSYVCDEHILGRQVVETLPVYVPGDICRVCKYPIKVMAFKGTGYCCENHRKLSLGETLIPKTSLLPFGRNE